MIHYHGCPMSGPEINQLAYARRHAMVSYANPETIAVVAEVAQSFSVDNGAFTAWKTGKAYDFDGYADFLSIWKRHPAFDWALIPDVIDGSEAKNDALIRQSLLKPQPHIS